MRPDEIIAGHTYAGKGADADKTRLVESINTQRNEATTWIYRDGVEIGSDTINVDVLARWAAADVTPAGFAMPPHTCHARDCDKPIPPRLLMCRKHWGMVPVELVRAVYRHYQPGQEDGRHTPTAAWHTAADAAIAAVAAKEAKKPTKPKQPSLFDAKETK